MSDLITGTVAGNRAGVADAVPAAVVDEHQVRAAAGLTMATGAVAFSYAYFRQLYWPLQAVSSLFAVEFLVRVTGGLRRSPFGLIAGLLTRRHRPDWVSTGPKRFAWTLGLAMAGAMAVITNAGIRGWLPRTICLICLTLMWLESVLGLCVGCEIHRLLVRRGWAASDPASIVCAHGACDTQPAPRP
ncbi:MAG TPA: DUF4395 domain-containing protein [Trebonia sp.]|nr:DUF4395 domain-containing protein [Trebonia sp.]